MNDRLQSFYEEFHLGQSTRVHEFLGCHPQVRDGQEGYVFRVWAPGAQSVSLVGEFNAWQDADLPMTRSRGGIWEIWTDRAHQGDAYKFLVRHYDGTAVYKADPVGFRSCRAPDTSSVICTLPDFHWHDQWYRREQAGRWAPDGPMNIYELHLGSWRRREDGTPCSYAELAPQIAQYAKNMGYTHVELLPPGEHTRSDDWGYQMTGYFSPTSRYGTPRELMMLVDTLHQAGVGVILDWNPMYFPKSSYGLCRFDGTSLYGVHDPKDGPNEGTCMFRFGKPEVRSFLISSAIFWLETYHADGIRVNDVSRALYLDESLPDYQPNRYGGNENLDAIEFLRQLNRACFALNPGVLMVAEESSAFPLVTKPDFDGGLGFLFQWDRGWKNDTLRYLEKEIPERRNYHANLTAPMDYAWAENFILPLSHNEVVGGKRSLAGRMPGDPETQLAQLRLLLGYQMACPGKKLLFMGGEFGQATEWNSADELDWDLLFQEPNRRMHSYTRDLNHFYLRNAPLWSCDTGPEGFAWVRKDDGENSILAFRRIDRWGRQLLCVLNFTQAVHEDCRLGLPEPGTWHCVFSSDEERYGGSGTVLPDVPAQDLPCGEYQRSGLFRIGPLSAAFYALGQNPAR